MRKMTRRKSDVLCMALSGMVAFAFYLSLMRPPQRAAASSRKEAGAIWKRAKDTARQIASFPGLAMKVKQYREKVAAVRQKMGTWSTPRDVVEVLVTEARRLGADVSISRDKESVTTGGSNGGGREISFRLRMPCSYRSFAEYVEAIGKAGPMMAVEQIRLTREDAAAKRLKGELTVKARLFPQ